MLAPVSRPEPVNPVKTYHILGAHWYAQGLYIKDVKPGSAIQADKVYRVEQGDFIYNRLFAWKGSFAIAGAEHNGCYVSNEFPCFTIMRDRADPRYLRWYLSRAPVWEEALSLSTGGTPTSRNRLKEEKFLAMTIPLPSLPEQRRIVARIEELAARLEEARYLQRQIESDARRLLLAVFYDLIKGVDRRQMKEIAPIIRRSVVTDPEEIYPELGIRSFGKGTFHKVALTGIEVGSKRLYRIEPGDLIFNNVFAWEGAVAVARPEDAGRFGSHRFITCVVKREAVTAGFLCFYFLTDEGLQQLGEASPGGAGRNRTLGLNALEEIKVPVPPYERQLWFDDLQGKVKAALQLQAETATELDALLPSVLDKAFKGEL